MDYLFYFILLALVAEILGTIGGFGSSLFFIPIAGYFLDFHSVLGITALFHVSSNLTKIFFFREGVDKKLLINIGIPAVVFVILGAFLSKYIGSTLLEFILSIFLILLSMFFLIFKNINIQPTTANSVTGGILSGLFAGLVGTGGAIRGLTLAAYGLSAEVFIATSAIIDLGIDASRSVVYFLNGYVHYHDLYLIPILFIVSVVGTYIGKKILAKVNDKQFKSLVLVLVLITGISTLVKILQ
jgi:uncharacterized membrane protein YfcA